MDGPATVGCAGADAFGPVSSGGPVAASERVHQDESIRVLTYGAEEAASLNHPQIDTGHLVLGLFREEGSVAAELLRTNAIDLASVRRSAVTVVEEKPSEPQVDPEPAPGIAELAARLADLIGKQELALSQLSEANAGKRLAHKPWTRQEALGPLIDWATTHHQCFARALTEPGLVVPSYPADEWVAPQDYRNFSVDTLISLWLNLIC